MGSCRLVGDVHFQAPRRFWTQTISAPSYTYLFTDPQPSANPALGVFHSAELPYLFGNVSTVAPQNVANLSRSMLDYWISFAVSLTPNDGKGTSSAL
jgi:carboxylesterase type B